MRSHSSLRFIRTKPTQWNVSGWPPEWDNLPASQRLVVRVGVHQGLKQYPASGVPLTELQAGLPDRDPAAIQADLDDLIQAKVLREHKGLYYFTEDGLSFAYSELERHQAEIEDRLTRANPLGPADVLFEFEVANPRGTSWHVDKKFLDKMPLIRKNAGLRDVLLKRMADVLDAPLTKGTNQHGKRKGLRKLDFNGTVYKLIWCVSVDGSVTFAYLLHKTDPEYQGTDMTSPCN
jgi:hypothetical protein